VNSVRLHGSLPDVPVCHYRYCQSVRGDPREPDLRCGLADRYLDDRGSLDSAELLERRAADRAADELHALRATVEDLHRDHQSAVVIANPDSAPLPFFDQNRGSEFEVTAAEWFAAGAASELLAERA